MAPALTRALLAAAIVAGIVFRVDGLGRRPLWYDEAATVLHLSGRSEAALASWYDGRALRRADVLGATATPADVVAAARADEPQSGPLYFFLAAEWQRVVGGSLAGLRAFSAAASVLSLALAALLAWRVFADAESALAVGALVALSPLHLRYAAEARPYALWSLALLLWMHATLVAERSGRSRAAIAQAVAFVAALFVHPLTLLALPAVLALAPGRPSLVASGIGASIWAIVSVPGWASGDALGRTTAWVEDGAGGIDRVRAWLGAVTSVFFRPGGEGGILGAAAAMPAGRIVWMLLGLGAGLGVVAALRRLQGERAPARRFVRLLTVLPWAVLATADLVAGGRRSAIARYLVPSWLGCELAVGRGLATERARAVLLVLLALGGATAIRTRTAAAWWDTDPPRLRALAAVADAVRARPAAIVLSDAAPTAIVELAYAWGDDVELRLGSRAPATLPSAAWDRVVVAAGSRALVAAVERAAGPTHALVPIGGAAGSYVVLP